MEKELVVEDPRRGKQQFTRSDESRDERAGVGVVYVAKRLERERKDTDGQYTTASIYPSSIFNWQSVRPTPSYTMVAYDLHELP